MSFMDIFSRPQKVLPDSDFAYLTTAIVVYQHDDEFAEPGMPDPVVPVLSGRTSEQTTCRDLVARVEQARAEAEETARRAPFVYFCEKCKERRTQGCFGPRCPGIPNHVPLA